MKEEGNKLDLTHENVRAVAESGHYVQAIILIHTAIEALMNLSFMYAVVMLNPQGHGALERTKLKSPGDFSILTEYRYSTVSKILVDLGIYNADLYRRLIGFNSMRNKVVHGLMKERLTARTTKNYYSSGINLWDEVEKIRTEVASRSSKTFMKTWADQNKNKVNGVGS